MKFLKSGGGSVSDRFSYCCVEIVFFMVNSASFTVDCLANTEDVEQELHRIVALDTDLLM